MTSCGVGASAEAEASTSTPAEASEKRGEASASTPAEASESVGVGGCRAVSNFSKGEKLGEGTYGSVYRARDKATGRVVALKRVKEQNNEREGIPQTSIREVSLLRRLVHPNIVRLLEVVVGTRVDSVFLVFEYCAHDLSRLVDTLPPFPLAEVKCIVSQLLGAVDYLHANLILHRDLKMSNLLLTGAGALKLCDFGLAREHSAFGELVPAGSGSGGGSGSSSGGGGGKYTPKVVTLWYRAPELLLGATRYGFAVDMWSVGCIVGELLLHRPLLPANTEIKQLEMICELLGTPSERIWPGLATLPLWPKLGAGLPENEFNELPTRFARVRPTPSTLELINALLTYDPEKRLSAPDALAHRWLRSDHPAPARSIASVTTSSGHAPSGGASASASNGARKRPAPAVPEAGGTAGSSSGSKAARTAVAAVVPPVSAVARIPSPTDVLATTARQC